MSPEDEKRFRVIIRQEVRAAIEGMTFSGGVAPLCGEPSFAQNLERMKQEIADKQAKKAAKKSAKEAPCKS